MDGVAYEAHQFGYHWPYPGCVSPQKLAQGANWTLSHGKDYVFYFGPYQYKNCETYYDDALRDFYNKFWAAGLPKKHEKMYYYMNAFPY